MPKAFCLLNHDLTVNQVRELKERFGAEQIEYPPESIQKAWAGVPLENRVSKAFLEPILSWLKDRGAGKNDCFIIQGEFGYTFALVDYALQQGMIPLHAVTQRVAQESREGETVRRAYIFEHLCFRPYLYFSSL